MITIEGSFVKGQANKIREVTSLNRILSLTFTHTCVCIAASWSPSYYNVTIARELFGCLWGFKIRQFFHWKWGLVLLSFIWIYCRPLRLNVEKCFVETLLFKRILRWVADISKLCFSCSFWDCLGIAICLHLEHFISDLYKNSGEEWERKKRGGWEGNKEGKRRSFSIPSLSMSFRVRLLGVLFAWRVLVSICFVQLKNVFHMIDEIVWYVIRGHKHPVCLFERCHISLTVSSMMQFGWGSTCATSLGDWSSLLTWAESVYRKCGISILCSHLENVLNSAPRLFY